MILAVCPNPCVDCTIEIEKFNVGRLNRIENKIERWAGKALNAAVGVARLGQSVLATGFIFETGGKRCSQYLDSENVANRFVWNKGSLRVNYKIIDGKSMMTEINDKGELVSFEKQAELLDMLGELSKNVEVCIISGSLPSGVSDDYYGKMVDAVKNNCKVIVDCEKDKMLSALSKGVYLAKPNLFELEEINNESYSGLSEMIEGAKKLISKGAKNVLLSLGKEGAILTNGEETYYSKTENVAVNSTVGAGDSLIAAVAVAIEKNASLPEILKAGVSAGTASVTSSGTNLFYRDKYDEIYEYVSIIKME